MFERFTERARRALFFARYESSQFGSPSIETEHLLLGLLRDGSGLTQQLFARTRISLATIRDDIEARILKRDKISTSIEIPFSDDAKRVLLHTVEEADLLGDHHIGTEHMLLGLLREERSLAATVLYERGLTLDAARDWFAKSRGARSESEAADQKLALLAQENAALREVIRHLEQTHQLPLEFRDNAYWMERYGTTHGPYCSVCWDVDRRLLKKVTDPSGTLYCEYCTRFRV